MLLVSEVEETEIFKICLEYWNHLAAELYRESPFSTSSTPLLSDVPPRRHLYLPVLSQVESARTHAHTHVLPVSVWVLRVLWVLRVPPTVPNTYKLGVSRFIGCSKLPVGVNVSADGCLARYFSPAMNW